MGNSYVVKYFEKVTDTAFEPLAHSKKSLRIELEYRTDLAWCKECNAAVKAVNSLCPFCNETTGGFGQ